MTNIHRYYCRFACLRCAACERYAFAGNRPLGDSKNCASQLADLSPPSSSFSTYKYLQFIGLKLKVQIVLVKIIGQGFPSILVKYHILVILSVNGIQN